MEEQLRRSSAVCRRDRRLYATFPGAQKCPQPKVESAVSSGFPTAVEPSLPRRLPPGTSPRALLTDRRENQLPLPRDDIPPLLSPLAVLGVCRLRLARMWFPITFFTLRLHSRVQYGKAGQNSFLVGSRSRSCGKANSG